MASAIISGSQVKSVKAQCNIAGGLVTSVTWSLDAEANTAEIQIPRKRLHEFRQYNAGKQVWVKIRRNFNSKLIFQGWITGRYFDFSQDSEMVSVVCADPRWYLQGDFVKGKCMLVKDGTHQVLSGHQCIFNEKIQNSTIPIGNAAKSRVTSGGYVGVRPFSLNPRVTAQCQAYTVNDMLWYVYKVGINAHSPTLLSEVLAFDEFGIGSLGDLTPYDVNVDGQNITEAMNTIFKKAGLRWWLRPISESMSEIKAMVAGPDTTTEDNAIYVGVNGTQTSKYLYLANVATGVAPTAHPTLRTVLNSTNNIEAGRVNEDFSSVFNRVHLYGSPKKYQMEFTLVPGWSDLAWNEIKATGATGTKNIRQALREKSELWSLNNPWAKVGREWILDEDGSVSGAAYDFTTLFGHASWSAINRPFIGERVDGVQFLGAAVKDPYGVRRGIEANIQVLKDKAGIYIEGDEIPAEILDEKNKTLATKLYITLAVPEDVALNKVAYVDNGQGGWQVGVVNSNNDQVDRRMCILADEYEADNMNATKATQTSTDMENFVTRKLLENKDPRLSASFTIPWITASYEPGDLVYGVKGRNVYFVGQIIEVRFSLGESQQTELVIEDLRLAEK